MLHPPSRLLRFFFLLLLAFVVVASSSSCFLGLAALLFHHTSSSQRKMGSNSSRKEEHSGRRRHCQAQACDIQYCLQRHNEQEAKCVREIEAWQACVKKFEEIKGEAPSEQKGHSWCGIPAARCDFFSIDPPGKRYPYHCTLFVVHWSMHTFAVLNAGIVWK